MLPNPTDAEECRARPPAIMHHLDIVKTGLDTFVIDGKSITYSPVMAYSVAHQMVETGHIQPGTHWQVVQELCLHHGNRQWMHTALNGMQATRLISLARHLDARWWNSLDEVGRVAFTTSARATIGFAVNDLYEMLKVRNDTFHVGTMRMCLSVPRVTNATVELALNDYGLTGDANCVLRKYLDDRMSLEQFDELLTRAEAKLAAST